MNDNKSLIGTRFSANGTRFGSIQPRSQAVCVKKVTAIGRQTPYVRGLYEIHANRTFKIFGIIGYYWLECWSFVFSKDAESNTSKYQTHRYQGIMDFADTVKRWENHCRWNKTQGWRKQATTKAVRQLLDTCTTTSMVLQCFVSWSLQCP